MKIRRKELKDCQRWVDINIKGWNDHFRKIVSDKLLKTITDNRDVRIEQDKQEFINDDWHYVLEEDNQIFGITKIKHSERNGFENCGEIQVLYVEKTGEGYGKALMNKAFEVLKDKGYKKAVVGCLFGNPSNEFYKHIGGKFVRQDPWYIFDEQYMENVYEYDL